MTREYGATTPFRPTTAGETNGDESELIPSPSVSADFAIRFDSDQGHVLDRNSGSTGWSNPCPALDADLGSFLGCGWESLMKNVTLGNVTMSHRTRERPAECLASLSHSTMIGLPRAQH
ncbi:hypothetical protein EVAR_88113_1 [Eumeta japonica]|uniref:Uncharacterized protein n=1 Tax=Eumeta variegata TaxID=151549 RepID=A0A4C2A1C0_EUMVA|nr:hypothetical protein EVAR_88113_1 [Eumeta japonica]